MRNSTSVYGSERRIALSGGNWELNFFDGHIWHQVPYEEGSNDWIVGIRQLQLEPSAGCPKPDFLSLVKDNKGTFWLTSDDVLYSVKDGKCKPAQEAGLPTPFLDGHRVSRAMTDPLGNTFLMTESGNSREYVIVPPQP